MTLEIFTLLATAALLFILAFISVALYSKQVGNAGVQGNREDVPPATGAAGRASRAHRNLIENALPFAIVVLAAQALDVSSALTAGAALVFLVARILHAVLYIAGVPVLRTFAWLAGVVATVVYGAVLLF